jgi:hypothetical protein
MACEEHYLVLDAPEESKQGTLAELEFPLYFVGCILRIPDPVAGLN